MASCQKNFGEYENALENYNKFMELNPTYADGNKLKNSIFPKIMILNLNFSLILPIP